MTPFLLLMSQVRFSIWYSLDFLVHQDFYDLDKNHLVVRE